MMKRQPEVVSPEADQPGEFGKQQTDLESGPVEQGSRDGKHVDSSNLTTVDSAIVKEEVAGIMEHVNAQAPVLTDTSASENKGEKGDGIDKGEKEDGVLLVGGGKHAKSIKGYINDENTTNIGVGVPAPSPSTPMDGVAPFPDILGGASVPPSLTSAAGGNRRGAANVPGAFQGNAISPNATAGLTAQPDLPTPAPQPPSGSDQELLLEATLVSDNPDQSQAAHPPNIQPDPELVTAQSMSKFQLYWKWIAGLLLLVLIVVIVVVVSLSATSSSSDSTPPISETPAPTTSPTMAPTPYVIDGLWPETIEAIANDPESPQAQAYAWVNQDPWKANYTNNRLMQRFAMATFYYATGGSTHWKENPHWLSYNISECLWFSRLDEVWFPGYDGVDACRYERGSGAGIEEGEELLVLAPWNNGLNGELPPEIGLLSSLIVADVRQNLQLRGTLPTEIGLLTSVEDLDVGEGAMSGTVPTEILSCTKLIILSGDSAAFTGTIMSEIFSFPQLSQFWFPNNGFTGTMPTQVGLATDLRAMAVNRGQMTGTLPTELGLLSTFYQPIWFHDNLFTGAIPSEIALMEQLDHLQLQNNLLTSTIPPELGNASYPLTLFKVENNILTGRIPTELGTLQMLIQLNLADNKLTSTIPSELGTNVYPLQLFRLENNQLSGTIPVVLTCNRVAIRD